MTGPIPLRLASVALFVLALVFAYMSYQLGFWRRGIPGSGLLPFVCAVLLVAPAIILFFCKPDAEDETGFDTRALLALPLLAVYAAAVPYLGLVPASLVLLAIWVRFFHEQSWLRAMVASALIVFGVALLFRTLSPSPLPLFPRWL